MEDLTSIQTFPPNKGMGLAVPIGKNPLYSRRHPRMSNSLSLTGGGLGWGWQVGGRVVLTVGRARELRKSSTDAEVSLWAHLRQRQLGGWHFRRQHPIGGYVVDFVCLKKRLVVEVDGGQHSSQEEYDSVRKDWLEARGFKVLRFWDNDVLVGGEAVKAAILEALKTR